MKYLLLLLAIGCGNSAPPEEPLPEPIPTLDPTAYYGTIAATLTFNDPLLNPHSEHVDVDLEVITPINEWCTSASNLEDCSHSGDTVSNGEATLEQITAENWGGDYHFLIGNRGNPIDSDDEAATVATFHLYIDYSRKPDEEFTQTFVLSRNQLGQYTYFFDPFPAE